MNTVNGLHKTMCVSFPRSGHHLLIRGLHVLLHRELVYSEYYKTEHNMDNCPYVNFQKNHDLGLDLKIDPNLHYIVQTRKWHPALISWYKLQVSYEKQVRSFKSWLPDAEHFADRWIDKWSNANAEALHVLYLDYDELCVSPFHAVLKVAKFIMAEPIPHLEDRYPELRRWSEAELTKQTSPTS